MPFKLIVQNSKIVLKTVANYIINVSGIKDLLTGTSNVDSNSKIDWTLQHYANTAANFTLNNPVLLVGQFGVETDDLLTSPKIKVGDGTTAWNSLPYLSSGSSSAIWGSITGTLSNQTDLQTALNAKLNLSGSNANQDIDIGNYSLNGKSLHIKGTAGNGHLGLKHQSANITASASESSLGADSSGNPVWKNDGNPIESIELQTNKTSTVTGNETSTSKYLTVKGVYDWVTGLFVKKGTLTTNTIPKATASDTIGDSQITDDGTNVGIGTLSPIVKCHVNGDIFTAGGSRSGNVVFGAYTFWGSASNEITTYKSSTGVDLKLQELGGGDVLLPNTSSKLNIANLTASQIVATDASKNLQSLDVATYPSLTELSHVKGLTSAAQTQLDSKLNIEANQTTGVALTFTTDSVYGSIATPETGNITYSSTGAKVGVTNVIIHNHSVAPTFATNMKKLSGSGSYVTSVVNYIFVTYINSTEVIYSINQRT